MPLQARGIEVFQRLAPYESRDQRVWLIQNPRPLPGAYRLHSPSQSARSGASDLYARSAETGYGQKPTLQRSAWQSREQITAAVVFSAGETTQGSRRK